MKKPPKPFLQKQAERMILKLPVEEVRREAVRLMVENIRLQTKLVVQHQALTVSRRSVNEN